MAMEKKLSSIEFCSRPQLKKRVNENEMRLSSINEGYKVVPRHGLRIMLWACHQAYSPCDKALNHFDDFYQAVFGERWPSVRLALLSKQKYFAVINNFGDIPETEEYLENQGAFNLRTFLEVQKNIVLDSSAKNEAEEKSKIELDNIMQQQLLRDEEEESRLLHAEGIEFKAKADSFSLENVESENENSDYYLNGLEDAQSSLESDFKRCQIDKSRLIMPDSMSDSATLNEFLPATELRGTDGFIAKSDYYKYYKVKPAGSFTIEEEYELDFPENLKVYTFDRGEILDFSEPTKCCNDVYNYLKLDGGDLLAALALDVQPKDIVLDLCSTSANISYCIFQMLRSKTLICAEDKNSVTENLFNQYLFGDNSSWKEMLLVTSNSVDETEYESLFDKVLVEAPSTFDKTALFEKTNNMFHLKNLKQRLRLPELQCSLLLKGMKLVRPGGTVVYTTSTLSPVQNEGVVNEALNNIWDSNKLMFTVKKLSPALQHMSFFFKFDNYLNLKFGTLVLPFVPTNFGPRYICKIVRNEKPAEENAAVNSNLSDV